MAEIGEKKIWKCKNHEIEYGKKTLVMGILNVTPDSFSDGGKFFNDKTAVLHALEMEKCGADIIDIGAQSTRPGYSEIAPEEEWKRLKGVLSELRAKTELPISIDTYFPYVAEKALQAGADIINDVSGVFNEEMARIVKDTGAGWIIMHSQGEKQSITEDVSSFFDKMLKECREYGINRNRLCFDMGIGFGKNYEENLELLANIDKYKKSGFPLLLGTSRKRVIAQSSGQGIPEKRVYGNIAADTFGIIFGADIIRLHDVENEIQGIKTADEILLRRRS